MARTRRSNPLALAVLCCLYEQPMHPYEMAQTLRSRAKHESIKLNYGSLYSVVDALAARDLIEARETVKQGRRPERTVYAITESGVRELTDWLAELLAVPSKEYTRFEAALSLLPALPPDDVVDLLGQREMALVNRLAQLRGGRTDPGAGIPRLFSLETEYVEALLEAELAFVRRLAKDIAAGDVEGMELWTGFHADDANR